MVIDCHVHLVRARGYVEKLVAECDKIGIDKVCLLAGPPTLPLWEGYCGGNEEVLAAYKRYPERIIPFGFFDLGVDPPSLIDRLFVAGFKGVKITRPAVDYDDPAVFPVYARLSALRMPVLFHTGTVVRGPNDHMLDIRCDRMRPIYLDTIARAFPTLKIIGAHLGNPWCEEAAMVMFWNPNVYFDLSGTLLKRKSAAWFKETLWWEPDVMKKLAPNPRKTHYLAGQTRSHPWSQVCFGTDVPVEEMAEAFNDYQRMLEALHIPNEIRKAVMGGNIYSIINGK